MMTEKEENIVQEAYNQLRGELKSKLEAFEKGYAESFEDYELWFDKFAPYEWLNACEKYNKGSDEK